MPVVIPMTASPRRRAPRAARPRRIDRARERGAHVDEPHAPPPRTRSIVRTTSIAIARSEVDLRAHRGPRRTTSERSVRRTSSGLRVRKKFISRERPLGVGEEQLELRRVGGGRVLPRRRERARALRRGAPQLVERDEHRLREIERRARRGRDRDHEVRAVELLVREPGVLAAEDQRHRAASRRVEQRRRRRRAARSSATSPRGGAP